MCFVGLFMPKDLYSWKKWGHDKCLRLEIKRDVDRHFDFGEILNFCRLVSFGKDKEEFIFYVFFDRYSEQYFKDLFRDFWKREEFIKRGWFAGEFYFVRVKRESEFKKGWDFGKHAFAKLVFAFKGGSFIWRQYFVDKE